MGFSTRPVSWVLAALLVAPACDTSEKSVPPAPRPALELSDVWIDAANAPRGENPLVAGEPILLGVRIRGGSPPYIVNVRANHQGEKAVERSPISASVTVAPTEPDSWGLEVGAASAVAAESLSGNYRLSVSVIDSANHRANIESSEFRVLGTDAPTLDRDAPEAAITIVDAAERRRIAFVPGERVRIVADVPEDNGRASVTISDPNGRRLVERTDLQALGHRLDLPVDLPRLASRGWYTASVKFPRRPAIATEFRVEGPKLETLQSLTIDKLTVYGGRDLRAPRAAHLRKGQQLRVETRIGGAKKRVTVTVRIRSPRGSSAVDKTLPTVLLKTSAPRLFVGGEFVIPNSLPAGMYTVEVEAREGKRVSSIHRQVLIS